MSLPPDEELSLEECIFCLIRVVTVAKVTRTRLMYTVARRSCISAASKFVSPFASALDLRILRPFCQLELSRKMQSPSWQELIKLPMIDRVKDKTLVRNQAFINGEFVDGPAAGTFDVLDPGNGAFLGSVPDMSEEATLLAIAAAKEAFPLWKAVPARERGLILRRWYDLIVQNTDDLAVIMTSECGKPLAEVCGLPSNFALLEEIGIASKHSMGSIET
jgi:hypothetical protein